MAGGELSPAKAVLLAVQLAHKAELSTLRNLIHQHQRTLQTDLVLRIVLSHLPESLNSSEYVPFLIDLVDENIVADPQHPVDKSVLDGLSEKEASKKVRKLHLLSLIWPNAPDDAPTDPITLFLIHRSLKIDENTGLITQVPALVSPFLKRSSYLRIWFISTILPLLRLNYEYHPRDGTAMPITAFERLDDETGVRLLLSRTGEPNSGDNDGSSGRDLRGLIGPWMYGDRRSKRRKLRKLSEYDAEEVATLETEAPSSNRKHASWEEVFKWITGKATTSWKISVQVLEQWNGPSDVDLGIYDDGREWLDEEDQQHLEQRYARTALATAYLMPETSLSALADVQRILSKFIILLDLDRIPTLDVSAGLLPPISTGQKSTLMAPKNAGFLRDALLDEENLLTKPTEESIVLLHALLICSFLFARERSTLPIVKAGQMALRQDENQQKAELARFMATGPITSPSRADDKYWTRIRNEILWMRSWGSEEIGEDNGTLGLGIFGQLSKEYIEIEVLKGLLSNSRFSLATQIYETPTDRPISKDALQETVISAAMEAFDNATNPNKTRGGLKRSSDILKAFPKTLTNFQPAARMGHLIMVTHAVGEYRLVLKQGELFKPVALRVHGDPISIVGRILEQNPKSYTKINDFVWMGKEFVNAGLTSLKLPSKSVEDERQLQEQVSIAERRVVAMCISAALAEDDFETAYSFVTTRLATIAGQAHADTQGRRKEAVDKSSPNIVDDWSWKAALEAGRYRRSSQTTKPTHLGNASGNPEIRHLQQRMDCLSHALRFAPKPTLQEILNAYRRCEEELEMQLKLEAEEEDAWDAQGDGQSMPGGFGTQKKAPARSSRSGEEAPMSLFDLSRASMARAQTGLSALSSVQTKLGNLQVNSSTRDGSGYDYAAAQAQAMRKRDQLKNAATDALASGVGWLIGATPQPPNSGERGT